MEESTLRAINPSVPLRDLEAAIWIVIVGICAAHLVFTPKIFASTPRHAVALLGISIAGLGLAYILVLNRPAIFFPAVLAYCAGFSVLCILMGRKASVSARRAAVFVSLALIVMVSIVYMLAFSPR